MMKKSKVILTITLFCAATSPVVAQTDFSNNEDSMFAPVNNRNVRTDSFGSDKEIPKGLKVWTIDERFGDRQEAQVDTLQHMYMNTPFTSGLRGEYNSLGNLGSPRINRIFIDECNRLYGGEPGDDATACVIKVRQRVPMNILFGPPSNRDDANRMMAWRVSAVVSAARAV